MPTRVPQSITMRAPRKSLFRIVQVTGIVFAAIALGLVGTGGTYAYLNAVASDAPSATVTAGTAALQISGDPLAWNGLAPGAVQKGTFTVTNVGDVPLVLGATVSVVTSPSGSANPFAVTVAAGTCPSGNTVPSAPLTTSVLPGDFTRACLVVQLPAGAPASAQGITSDILVTVTGTQS